MTGPIVLDIVGTVLSQQERCMLSRAHVGGVIFFARNYFNPKQFVDLVGSIRSLRPELLLCVDQEGGRVQRFKTGLTILPAMQVIGRFSEHEFSGATSLANDCGWLMAAELRALDIDLSFAPVLDLDDDQSQVIGDRAFSKKPQRATVLAKHFMEGMNEAGMHACAKHFPGHGSVVADSHVDTVIDERPLSKIKQHDLIPFEALKDLYRAVMPAHVIFSDVAEQPVGFSPLWLQTILRQDMKFKGLVFSDDLTMAAARYAGNVADAAVSALKAGCDAALICNHPQDAVSTLDRLESLDWPVEQPLGPLLASKMGSNKKYSNDLQPEHRLDKLRSTSRWQQAHKILTSME